MAMNVRRGAKRRFKVAAPKDKKELADQKQGFRWNEGQQAVIDALLHRDGKDIRELLIAAGSRSGKTFMIVALFVTIAIKYPGSRQLMARKYFAHIKGAIWADTLPKVLQMLFPEVQPHIYWNNTDYYIQFHNGSEIWFAGLDDKERVDKILGREYLNIFFNEASEIDYETYLIVKTRLAQKIEGIVNRVFVDENPPSSRHWTKKLFVDRKDPQNDKMPIANPTRYFYYQIHPWQNADNVSADYLEMLRNMPEKQKKRFYDGEFRDDSEHALWKTDDINRLRIPMGTHPPLRKIVVSIDPAVTAKEDSDETGIIVKGIGYNGHLYTLADYTGKYSATDWAAKAVEAYNIWQADEIIAEVNNGGDLVEVNIKSTEGGKYIPYRGVHATRDKYTRAEPVAALTEKGLAHHVGHFPDLEEEQTTWAAKKGEKSPNRIDADVWAAFALIPEMEGFRQKAGVGGSFMQAMRGTL